MVCVLCIPANWAHLHRKCNARGPMDKASAYGAEDSRFDPWRACKLQVTFSRSVAFSQPVYDRRALVAHCLHLGRCPGRQQRLVRLGRTLDTARCMPLHRAPRKSSSILQPALPQPRLSPSIALVHLTVGQTTSLSVSLTACTSDATQYIWMTEWYSSADNDMHKVRVLNTDREQTPDAQPIRQLYGGCPFLFLAINPLIPRCIAPKAETLPFFTAVPVFAAALQMCTCHARQLITAFDKADRAGPR